MSPGEARGPLVAKVGVIVREDPVLRFTPNNKAVAEFTISVKPYVPKDQPQSEATFYKVTCWQSLGEHVAESLKKGDRVVVVGEGKTETYVKRDGSPGSSKVIVANGVGPDLRFSNVDVHRRERAGRASQTVQTDESDEPF